MTTSPFKYPTSCENAEWLPGEDRWGTRDSDKWPEGFPKPRSCSFCGSVHPDDLIVLLEMDWEYEPSTKGYKSYWNPPGTQARYKEVLAEIKRRELHKLGEPNHVSPVPPVKMYGNHVTEGHVEKINALLKRNREQSDA